MKYHVVVGQVVGSALVDPDFEDINLVLDGIIRPWTTGEIFHCGGRQIDPQNVMWVRVFRSPDTLSSLRSAHPNSNLQFLLTPESFLSGFADEIPSTQLVLSLEQGDRNSMSRSKVQHSLKELRSEFSRVSYETLAYKREKFREFKETYGDQLPELPALATEDSVADKFWHLLTVKENFSVMEARWVGKWFLDGQGEVYEWVEKTLAYTAGTDLTEAAQKFVEVFVDPYLSFLEDHMGSFHADPAPGSTITIHGGISGGTIQFVQGRGHTATQYGPTNGESGKEIVSLLRELRNLIDTTESQEAYAKESVIEVLDTAIEEVGKPEPRTSRVKALVEALPDWVKTLKPYATLMNTLVSLTGHMARH